MARVNWKYVLKERPAHWKDVMKTKQAEQHDVTVLWAPAGARHISVDSQANSACMWTEVDPTEPYRWYRVYSVGTGTPLPDGSLVFLGRSIQTIEGRMLPAPVDNSIHHYYLVDESSAAAEAALALPKLGPETGEVIPFPLWAVNVAGAA